MSGSNALRTRRNLFLTVGASLLGVAYFVMGRGKGKKKNLVVTQPEVAKLAAQLNMPRDIGSLMRSFSRDPEKVSRFQELTRWRKLHGKEGVEEYPL